VHELAGVGHELMRRQVLRAIGFIGSPP
jgi:hypothetical protein